jgi:hypothetical protein
MAAFQQGHFEVVLSDADARLWSEVVLQARDDVALLPIGSQDYESAAAFLTSGAAYWRQARADVANHLFLHEDDIKRAGVQWVIARRRAEGLPDHEPPPAPKPAVVVRPEPERKPLVVPEVLREAIWARRRRLPENNPFHRVRA